MKHARPDTGASRRASLAMALMLAMAMAMALATATATATCDKTGEPAPDVTTLMASKLNPATDAWLVSPTCDVATIPVDSIGNLNVKARGVERVASVPTSAVNLYLTSNALSRGGDFSKATKMTYLSLDDARFPSTAEILLLPPSLTTLSITQNPALSSLDGLQLPLSLQNLVLIGTSITTLKNAGLPARLTGVTIGSSKLTTKDLQYLPAALQILTISVAPFGDMERVPLPSELQSLACTNCGISSIRGIKWPSSFKTLILDNNTISTFEIRASDFATFQELNYFTGKVAQTTCSGTGDLQDAGKLKLCVISDNEFESQYANGLSPSSPTSSSGTTGDTPSLNSPSGRGSRGDDGSGSLESPASKSSSQAAAEGSVPGDSTSSATSDAAGLASGSQSTTNLPSSPNRPRSQDAPSSEAAGLGGSASSNSSHTVIIVSTAVSIAFVGIVFFVFATRRKRQHKGTSETAAFDKFGRADTPSTSSDQRPLDGSASTAPSSLAIDFWNDRDLVRHRIDNVRTTKHIARGGYGVVFRGTHRDRVVAIKQMLPDAWQHDSMITIFLDEIRLCSQLNHPKIVAFIGVSWNSLRDLSIVSEFMAGGDLHSVLRKYPESTGREWSRPWTTSNLRNKTLIAMDIAEAVVYLHSLEIPIIHRDLKAKNVLLNTKGNAKLSDFGISRSVSLDETMTSEIGTAAWIAPEVLRGERYSEKADIYSLGVLLVELDRCTHPYADEPVLLAGTTVGKAGSRGSTSRVAHKNTQIAVLVSTGRLKPSASSDCPEAVATLITRCLAFEASERPAAMEVFYKLRVSMKTMSSEGKAQ